MNLTKETILRAFEWRPEGASIWKWVPRNLRDAALRVLLASDHSWFEPWWDEALERLAMSTKRYHPTDPGAYELLMVLTHGPDYPWAYRLSKERRLSREAN